MTEPEESLRRLMWVDNGAFYGGVFAIYVYCVGHGSSKWEGYVPDSVLHGLCLGNPTGRVVRGISAVRVEVPALTTPAMRSSSRDRELLLSGS